MVLAILLTLPNAPTRNLWILRLVALFGDFVVHYVVPIDANPFPSSRALGRCNLVHNR